MNYSISRFFGKRDAFKTGGIQPLPGKPSQLSGLVVAGLCLRHKLPFAELGAVFPDFDLPLIEDQLSQVMADPATSRRYFENLDRFDADFVGILGLEPSGLRPPGRGNSVSARVESGDRKLAIPCMPVAQRPLLGWLR